MSKKIYIIIAVVVLLIVGGYLFFYGKPGYQAPSSQTPVPETPTADNSGLPIVIYTDKGFSPNPIVIKTGTTVDFKNSGSKPMRVASAVHPTHAVYPTTGGCVGSTFDACKEINPGETWSFKFDYVGSWKYHDHLNPVQTGVVFVMP